MSLKAMTSAFIPTMFDYAHLTGRQEIHDHAVRMDQCESKLHMHDGVVQGGVIGDMPTPGDQRFIRQSQKTADALLQKQKEDGSLSRRFNSDWESVTDWSCLTGDVQISIIWGSRLYQETNDPKYNGSYGRFEILNWAVKFYMDALMLENSLIK